MNVIVDIDDTMNEFSLALAEAYKAESGIDALSAIRKHYFLEEAIGWTSDDVIAFFERHHDNLFVRTKIKEYLPDMFDAMTRRFMNIHIVTNRMFEKREVTLDWLHDTHCSQYIEQLWHTPGDKYEFCVKQGLEPDVIIEDRLDRVKPFLAAKIPAILFDYGHNQGYEHPLLYRVTNWWDAYQVLCRIQQRSRMVLR